MEMIGLIAASLTTAAFVPQVVQTWRTKSAEGISLGMYLIFCIGLLLWLIYGISKQDIPVIAANAATLLLALTILYFKISFRK